MGDISPSTSAMQEAANAYAFYVSQKEIAAIQFEKLKKENESLEKRNNQLLTDTATATAALTDLQTKVKVAKGEFDSYEKRESERLMKLKSEATAEIRQLNEAALLFKSRSDELDAREQEVTRGEFQVKATIDDLMTRTAQVALREKTATDKEEYLTNLEVRVKQKETAMNDRELILSSRELDLAKRKEQVASDEQKHSRREGDTNTREREVSAREEQVKLDALTVAQRQKDIAPFVALYKEFRETALKYAHDEEKITAWLGDHASA